MAVTNTKTTIPEFVSEREEALWRDEQKGMLESNLIAAMRDGTARKDSAQRMVAEARGAKNITIRMPLADLERARQFSAKEGACLPDIYQDVAARGSGQ